MCKGDSTHKYLRRVHSGYDGDDDDDNHDCAVIKTELSSGCITSRCQSFFLLISACTS